MPVVVAFNSISPEITRREVSDDEVFQLINIPREYRVAAYNAICEAIAEFTGSAEGSYTEIPQNLRYEFIARLKTINDATLHRQISRSLAGWPPDQLELIEAILLEMRQRHVGG